MPQTLEDILNDTTTVKVAGRELTLETGKLKFNEANLSKFIEDEAIWYDHFGNALADAEAEMQMLELDYDTAYSRKFAEEKEKGGSDKLVESKAKADPEVENLRKAVINAKRNVKLLQQHLRAWDKCHENAQNRGHTLRKEMDKLNGEIYGAGRAHDDGISDLIEEMKGKE